MKIPIVHKQQGNKTSKQMKAQISGQIFIYIFAMLVVALLLIFGYKAVSSITKAGTCAEVMQFKNKIISDIAEAQGYGTEKKNKEYNLPAYYNKICFADLENPDLPSIGDKLIRNEVQSKTKNAFMIPKTGNCADEWFLIRDVGTSPKYKCFISEKGRLKVNLIGCGDKTIITDPQTATSGLCT